MDARSRRAALLFDFAVSKPNGFTLEDIEREFSWDRKTFFVAVRQLRTAMQGDDEINLVCNPRGSRQTWLYRLVGNYTDAKPWMSNRMGDMERRLETVQGVASSIKNATDGRSKEGRKARKVLRTVSYLIEELAAIEEEMA